MTLNRPELEPTKVPTAIDIAWAAGIFEGEGSCVASGHEKKSFSVTVSQKDPELLYRLRDMFGGGIKLYNTGKERRFPIYYWHLCGDRGRAFIGVVYPFLTARRKVQIDSTAVSEFLVYASDLLIPTEAVGACERYKALCGRVARFTLDKRDRTAEKRSERIDAAYYRQRYAEKSKDPAWMESRRIRNQQWKKSRKEQRQASANNLVAIA
jgi:hypothetical protein